MHMLTYILVDDRHDWPGNGAALALLQYSHQALSNSEIFIKIEENNTYDTMVSFVKDCTNKETKRHLHEAITLVQMSRTKMSNITHIYNNCIFAGCA